VAYSTAYVSTYRHVSLPTTCTPCMSPTPSSMSSATNSHSSATKVEAHLGCATRRLRSAAPMEKTMVRPNRTAMAMNRPVSSNASEGLLKRLFMLAIVCGGVKK